MRWPPGVGRTKRQRLDIISKLQNQAVPNVPDPITNAKDIAANVIEAASVTNFEVVKDGLNLLQKKNNIGVGPLPRPVHPQHAACPSPLAFRGRCRLDR